jgi:hypothetical protein
MAECPFCFEVLNTRDILRGKLTVCPRCGKGIGQAAPAPPESSATKPAARRSVAAPSPVRGEPEAAPAFPPQRSAPKVFRDAVPPRVTDEENDEAEHEEQARVPFFKQLARVDAPTLAAFLIGSFTLSLAALPLFSFLAKPLSLLGLLLALFGSVLPAFLKRGSLVFPVLVALLCLGELLFMGNWPRWGSTYPLGPVAVPLNALVKEMPSLQEEDWVDASNYAIRDKNLRVQIVSARLISPALLAKAPKPKEKLLLLEVRVNYQDKNTLTFEPWSGGADASTPHAPTLIDNTERSYVQVALEQNKRLEIRKRPRRVEAKAAVPAGTKHAASDPVSGAPRPRATPEAASYDQAGTPQGPMPGNLFGDALLYPAPPPEVEYLRLELPASALGLPGQFRFQIPRTMIQGW